MAKIKFKDNSIIVKNEIKESVVGWLNEVSMEFKSQAQRSSPVDNGQLKTSWDSIVDEGELKATIGSEDENAIWNEYGTGDYAAKGNGRKGAWYIPVNSYKGKKKPSYNGKVVVVYGKNGMKFYKTNGKKAEHTLEKVFTRNKAKAKKALENKLRGLNK